jgi:hypothetical protein
MLGGIGYSLRRDALVDHRVVVHDHPVDDNRLVEDLIDIMRRQIMAAQVPVMKIVPADKPIIVRPEPALVEILDALPVECEPEASREKATWR